MRVPRLALIAVGGVVGSLGRYLIAIAVGAWSAPGWPWATFTVNVLGCLVIGMVAAQLDSRPAWVRPLVITGVLGGFTTFSAFALEAGILLDAGAVVPAAAYVLTTLVVGLLAVRAGALIVGGRRP